MKEKLHPFQTAALVEVSGQFNSVVSLLSEEKTPNAQEFRWDKWTKHYGRVEEDKIVASVRNWTLAIKPGNTRVLIDRAISTHALLMRKDYYIMLFNAFVSVANVFQHRRSWEGGEDEWVGMD